ncbi:SDR family NAD(P)-dependent oxidoreductase [Novosphingobium album (ex Liu et al. 2023)]|uniref:SDR family NAD(P)-dependent oxidoreductase n=1 Tax=Novosphingobium album (ex Liu et al. 2023) TaxID=3031130 RepID=A0ABT5WTR8_9SPHN|nr:SDR family NAD(P)-dependent oxidoreductase [Novosphingobium album (ex Liu et al. 2023)]MDE8653276.1 SDR family NAD(P)-dependent oxidoreductase [Novosphingobium album (ex Liu et al. 2023)]
MRTSLNGRVAVVTGAGSGMGRAIAERLAADGAAVAIWDVNGAGAAETAATITAAGGTALAITADCADRAAIEAAASETRATLGPITILVNNAGIAPFTRFLDVDDAELDKVLHINLRGPFILTREIVPDMLAAGWGRIINITSSSTQTGSPMQSHYVASKGGLLGLTKALALELGGSGITVNMIPPGSIDTPMLRGAAIMTAPDAISNYGAALPVKRIGTVDDIAAAASYLASEEASYITGQTISVNGGRYMGSA